MPDWAQKLILLNPIRYFVEIIRMVMLKGARFSAISRPFFIIAIYVSLSIVLPFGAIKKRIKFS
jgi:ABC-2 type transport system permease protein